jgi:hypothetical protein
MSFHIGKHAFDTSLTTEKVGFTCGLGKGVHLSTITLYEIQFRAKCTMRKCIIEQTCCSEGVTDAHADTFIWAIFVAHMTC